VDEDFAIFKPDVGDFVVDFLDILCRVSYKANIFEETIKGFRSGIIPG